MLWSIHYDPWNRARGYFFSGTLFQLALLESCILFESVSWISPLMIDYDFVLAGYLPSQRYRQIPAKRLRDATCQRCTLMNKHNIALNVSVQPEVGFTKGQALRNFQFIKIHSHKAKTKANSIFSLIFVTAWCQGQSTPSGKRYARTIPLLRFKC